MNSAALKYGTWMFLGFTGFFLLMVVLKMNYNLNLRLFNGVIHISLIYLAISEFERKNPNDFNYLSGTATGMMATIVGVLPFALFQLIFLNLDEPFLTYIQQNTSIGEYLTPFTATLIIFMEGIMVGLLASYACMRIVEIRKNKREIYE